jgi:hypothetical protein
LQLQGEVLNKRENIKKFFSLEKKMTSPVPRLINFSEVVQRSFENQQSHTLQQKESLNNLSNAYRKFINDMRLRACENNGYWTFDLNIVSIDDVKTWCESNNTSVISQQWRLIGMFEDLVSLAKLAGYTYQPQGREIVLPGFGPEESYWIRSLQMVKLCHNGSIDSDANLPCADNYSDILSRETPLLWKTESTTTRKRQLCHCCTQDMCRTRHQGTFQSIKSEESNSCPYAPLSRIEPVKIELVGTPIPAGTTPTHSETIFTPKPFSPASHQSTSITVNPGNSSPITITTLPGQNISFQSPQEIDIQGPSTSQKDVRIIWDVQSTLTQNETCQTGTFCKLAPGGDTSLIGQLSPVNSLIRNEVNRTPFDRPTGTTSIQSIPTHSPLTGTTSSPNQTPSRNENSIALQNRSPNLGTLNSIFGNVYS